MQRNNLERAATALAATVRRLQHVRRPLLRLALIAAPCFLFACDVITESALPETATPAAASPSPITMATNSPLPPPTETGTAMATATAVPAATATPATAPSLALSPTLAPTATAPPAEAPTADSWLLYRSAQGLMALPPGDGDPLQLAPAPIYQWEATTAGGRLLVATVSGAPGDALSELRLEVHDPGAGDILLSQPLTSPETAIAPGDAPGALNFEIARALTEVDSLAWSPGGRQLAFMGAHEGPSSDLYLFDVAAGSIQRLTTGPSNGIKPAWSPDGAYIVHLGVSTLGTGAGYGVDGMWAAAADGDEIVTLEVPEHSGDEVWLGWFEAHTLLVYTFDPTCGDQGLRTVDVATGAERMLWSGAFSAIAYSPASGHALLSLDAGVGPCNPSAWRGLLITHPQAQNNYITHEQPAQNRQQLKWSPALGAFLAADEEMVVSITTEGDVTPLPSPVVAVPTLSPDGVWAAWPGEGGLWVGAADGEANRVHDGASFLPRWTPEGSLFFFTAGGLFHAAPPAFTPVFVATSEGVHEPVVLTPD